MALWREKRPDPSFGSELQSSIDEPPLTQRLELLEIEIDLLKKQLKETQDRLTIVEQLAFGMGDQKQSHNINSNEGIYTAFDQGKSIVEIAKIFNKGKGEVELILNLRNLK